ncbi:alpha/beta hydrolase [Kribbella sp. CA-293567]|uniref:alpha/beta hydrolase n=1 Tax=Kribbella sp. CA-293567 TaxID=3002436 RepID=UPI0022DE5B78|nr:alpha/beta hydrolase [Kribbella sp. CA-293567]WBQ07929.1 alpha/beta hydrolase [Kribbella sp. CA-293567]
MSARLLRATAALTAVAMLVPGVANATSRGPAVPKINWGTCGADPQLAPFQCATVEVPTDYDRPRGATTTIALTRLPAGDPARKIGTLFTNPGGPGGSGVEFVQKEAQKAYRDKVRARFDILGFDPRGVGKSDQVTCFPTAAEEAALISTAPHIPLNKTEFQAGLTMVKKLSQACAKRSGDRMAHFSTANVVRDMDLLRQAVGDRKLTYAGYSYGTFLGATYARYFPSHVRGMVLDGTADPVAYSDSDGDPRPFGIRSGQGPAGAEAFAQFTAECKKAGPQECSLAALGDPAVVAERVLQGLTKKPGELTGPDGTKVQVNYGEVVTSTFQKLYDPTSWRALADLYAQLAGPAGAAPRTTAAAVLPSSEAYTSHGSFMQTCVDGPSTGRPREYAAWMDKEHRIAPHFGRYAALIGLDCEFFPIKDHDAYRGSQWHNTVQAPVMVVGTRYDPATPYKNTRPYADLFPRGRMVTYEGWGHVASMQNTCVDRLVETYLVDLEAPADNTTCTPDRRPFDPKGTN